MDKCMNMYIYIYTNERTHTHIYIYIYTELCVYIYICVNIYLYAYTHTCIPTKMGILNPIITPCVFISSKPCTSALQLSGSHRGFFGSLWPGSASMEVG